MDVVSDAHVTTTYGDSVYVVERTGSRDFVSVYPTEGIRFRQMNFSEEDLHELHRSWGVRGVWRNSHRRSMRRHDILLTPCAQTGVSVRHLDWTGD